MSPRKHNYIVRRTTAKMHIFFGIVFTLGAATVWLLLNMGNIEELTETWNRRDAERQQIEDLKDRIRKLKKQQQSLADNGFETERLMRERLGRIAPGETLIFLHEEGTSSTTTSSGTQNTEN